MNSYSKTSRIGKDKFGQIYAFGKSNPSQPILEIFKQALQDFEILLKPQEEIDGFTFTNRISLTYDVTNPRITARIKAIEEIMELEDNNRQYLLFPKSQCTGELIAAGTHAEIQTYMLKYRIVSTDVVIADAASFDNDLVLAGKVKMAKRDAASLGEPFAWIGAKWHQQRTGTRRYQAHPFNLPAHLVVDLPQLPPDAKPSKLREILDLLELPPVRLHANTDAESCIELDTQIFMAEMLIESRGYDKIILMMPRGQSVQTSPVRQQSSAIGMSWKQTVLNFLRGIECSGHSITPEHQLFLARHAPIVGSATGHHVDESIRYPFLLRRISTELQLALLQESRALPAEEYSEIALIDRDGSRP